MPRDPQHPHLAGRDRLGGLADRDAVPDADPLPVPRPQQVLRLRERAPPRDGRAAHALAPLGLGHARQLARRPGRYARARDGARADPPRRHAVRGRQRGAAAGERRGDVRGDPRGDRSGASLRDRAVLHRARRHARRNAARRAARLRRARPALLSAVRQHRQLRPAARLREPAARGRRRGPSVRHPQAVRQPLPAQLPQSPQDRGGGRRMRVRGRPQRGRGVSRREPAALAVARHAHRAARAGGRQHPVRVRGGLALGHPVAAGRRADAARGAGPGHALPGGADGDRPTSRRPARCSSSRRSTRRASGSGSPRPTWCPTRP